MIELDDIELNFEGLGGARIDQDEKHLKDPRMCDYAALNLSSLYPAKYRFVLQPTYKEMDAVIATFKEIYRASQR